MTMIKKAQSILIPSSSSSSAFMTTTTEPKTLFRVGIATLLFGVLLLLNNNYSHESSTGVGVRFANKYNDRSVGDDNSIIGYYNLSCPFEMSEYSCAYKATHNELDLAKTFVSQGHYLHNLQSIRNALDSLFHERNFAIRIFMTGDSLTRQLFISIACNAFSLYGDRVKDYHVEWKDVWPFCREEEEAAGEDGGGGVEDGKGERNARCIRGGIHGGFDRASITFKDGGEIHFVPHDGFLDNDSAETNLLERLRGDLHVKGTLTFGDKTALVPGGPMDVLVYNAGIRDSMFNKRVEKFGNRIGRATLKKPYPRPRIIYVTTPTNHLITEDGDIMTNNNNNNVKKCSDTLPSNPKADFEKGVFRPGFNVDALVDSDDLNHGMMHVGNGDCRHYCMPGIPDLVATRLLEAIFGSLTWSKNKK